MTEYDVTMIIVNYQSEDYLDKCLSSIYEQFSSLRKQVIVVNNGASNDCFEEIRKKYLDVVYISNDENPGFSSANNLGAQMSSSPYLAFINPDTVLIEDCVTPILQFFEKNSKCGVCAPLLLNTDMTYQNSSGFRMGLFYEFAEAFFLINLIRKAAQKRLMRNRKVTRPQKVAWLSGAFMVMRKSIFDKIGGFDTNYFLNYEDIDLCRRVEDLGLDNYIFPYLKCIHKGLASQSKDFQVLVESRYKSRIIYAKNHYKYLVRLIVKLIHIIGLFIRIFVFSIFLRSKEGVQRLQGYRESLKFYLNLK